MASLSGVFLRTLGPQRSLYIILGRNVSSRYISTSKGKKESVVAPHSISQEVAKETTTADAATTKKWISFGYDTTNETEDRVVTHGVFLLAVTGIIIFGSWWKMYTPDFRLTDWAHREAYVELRRREREGLPLIDGNLVDPTTVILPSDEELGDAEIII